MLLLQPLLLCVLSLLSFSSAQRLSNHASSVFVYDGADHTEFIFALNVDRSTGDIYFHLSSPAGNSWVGVGIGSEMKDSLMFIAYPGSSGKDVTISPRVADGHSEPTYQKDIKIEKQSGDGLVGSNTVNGTRENKDIVADAVCRSCTKWNGGSLDLNNPKQPFIFAVGDIYPEISSDSQSAGISRHMFYGHFTMDMTAATSAAGGSVPLGPYKTKRASPTATSTTEDNDPAPHIHGLVMSVVFIILMPLSSLFLRVWNKVRGHYITNIVALVLFCMAFAGGAVVSQEYNKSKNFNSAHQIIGILLLLALFTQLTLGALHHRIYKREQRATLLGKIHRYLGPAILFFGLINGGIGFAFAGAGFLAIPYCIAIVIFGLIYTCIRVGTRVSRRRRGVKETSGPEGYQYPQFGHPPPGQYAPPAGAPPPYGQQDVPLERYHSSQSVNRSGVDDRPMEARPMV